MLIHHMNCQVSLAVGSVRTVGAFEGFLTRVNQVVAFEVGAKDKSLSARWALMPPHVWLYQFSASLQMNNKSPSTPALELPSLKKQANLLITSTLHTTFNSGSHCYCNFDIDSNVEVLQ